MKNGTLSLSSRSRTFKNKTDSQYLPLLKIVSQLFTLSVFMYLAWYFMALFNRIDAPNADRWQTVKDELPICILLFFPLAFRLYLIIPQNFAQSFVDFCNSAGISIPGFVVLVLFFCTLAYYLIAQIETSKKAVVEKILYTLGGLMTGGFLQKAIDNRTDSHSHPKPKTDEKPH